MSASNKEPSLAALLRRSLCPTPTQTLLLRSCLCGDLEAWEQWCRIVGDPKRELGNDSLGIKRLVPLLYVALRDSGAKLDADFLSYLRAAYVREELRARTFRRVCGEALSEVRTAKVPFIVLSGVSLAESAYPIWALRHCHDVDILVERSDFPAAISALQDFRFYSANQTNTTLVHPTNLPVSLQSRLFECYRNPDGVYEESLETSIADVNVRVLAPHHGLLHICVHAASGPNRRMLLWVADAMHLLRYNPELDWKKLVVSAGQIALPAYVMLRYLRDEMNADISPNVLQSLAEKANRHYFAALKGAVATSTYRGLLSDAKNGNEKAWVCAWMVSELPFFCSQQLKKRAM